MLKRLLCAAAISVIALVAAGCDDDDSDRRHRRAHRDDHRHYDDRRDHRPPPPSKERNIKERPQKERPPKDRKRPPRPPREKRDIAGAYSALALNDAVTAKGNSYYVDIFEDNGKLFLVLPNGKEYPISFENGEGAVAGGVFLEQDEGKFFYTDKKGGAWLIERIE